MGLCAIYALFIESKMRLGFGDELSKIEVQSG
jgi:hypothetical protein